MDKLNCRHHVLACCPFCGDEANLYTEDEMFFAICSKCGASTKKRKNRMDAIIAWNTRLRMPKEEEVAEMIDYDRVKEETAQSRREEL